MNNSDSEAETKFNLQRLETLMSECAAEGDDLNLSTFGDALLEICKLLSQMGTVLSMAFQDVKDKADVIRNNYEFWCDGLSEDFMTMQEVADEEDSSGVLKCNGENNSDIIKVTNPTHKWKETYASSMRHLVRCGWFSNFMV